MKKNRLNTILFSILLVFACITILMPHKTQAAAYKGSIQKLDAFTSHGESHISGYYYYPSRNTIARKAGVLYISQATIVDGHYFKGYYFYNSNGLITTKEWGLIKLNNIKASNGKLFDGYYYRGKGGMIVCKRGIKKITQTNGCNASYQGYRYFGKGGKLVTKKGTHYLNTTCNGTTYKGYYCFAGKNGKMSRIRGLIQNGETYYFVRDNTGKCYTNGKKYIDGFQYSFNKRGKGTRRSNLTSLKNKLNSMISGYGGTWSVYVKRMDNDDYLVINDTSLYAASIIKPFVMASFYQQAADKKLTVTSSLTGTVRSMITVSDNESYNQLVRAQGSGNFSTGKNTVNDYLSAHGYTNTSVHHTLHPSSSTSWGDGGRNVTSVKDCGDLLEQIYRQKCVNKNYSRTMLNFLLAQQRRWKIPAGIPSGIKVANKTGETSTSDHDIAIVYGKKCTYIICVMSQNASNAGNRIAQISSTVYQALN